MVKKTKSKKNKIEYNAQFWMSIAILVIMILSIAGFALISAGPTSKSSSGTYVQQDIPLQYYEQYGVWATIKNSEQFVFKDINQFNNMKNIKDISNEIINKTNLNLYVDPNFDQSSLFLIKKGLNALNIKTDEIYNPDCNNNNNLIIINSESNLTINGNNCIKFIANSTNSYNLSNALVYYLVK